MYRLGAEEKDSLQCVLPVRLPSYPVLPHPTPSYTRFFNQPTLFYPIKPPRLLPSYPMEPHPTWSYTRASCNPTLFSFFCVSTVLYTIHLCSLLPLISPLPISLPLPLPLSLSLSPPPPPSLPPSPHFSPYFISLPPPSPSLPPPIRRPTEATDSAPSPTKVARRRTKAEIARLDRV